MIKINLAKKKNFASASSDGGEGNKFSLQKLGISVEDLKELPIKTVVVCLLMGYFSTDRVENYKQIRIEENAERIKTLVAKQNDLNQELGKTKDYDIQKKQLEADEATLRGKIDAIQKLISDRLGLYHSLLAMTNAIPTGVWLTTFEVKSVEASFRGSSMDINQVSDFMKRLGETPHFKEITLKKTDQSRDSSGADVANFELTAKRR